MRGSMQATTTLLAGLLWHSTASGPGAVADTPQPTDVCTGSAGLRDDRIHEMASCWPCARASAALSPHQSVPPVPVSWQCMEAAMHGKG